MRRSTTCAGHEKSSTARNPREVDLLRATAHTFQATSRPQDSPLPAVASPRRKNSFDSVRFVAAALVLVSHSFALTGHVQPMVGNVTVGTLAVWIFFIMSGFLIAQSWIQYPRFMVFMIKRTLRIFPALIVVLVLSIVCLGALSTLPYFTYLKTPGTLQYLNNVLLVNTTYELPGVFSETIYPNAVNGSLWTLAYEFTMYLSIAYLGVLSLLRKWSAFGIWIGLLALNLMQLFAPSEKLFHFSLFYLDAKWMAQLALMFYTGVVMYVFARQIPFKAGFWAPALGLFAVGAHFFPSYTAVLGGVLLGYGVLGFCHLRAFSGFGRFGDFSYGVYIYAFVVQQVVAELTRTHSPLEMFALAFPATVLLGALSWHLVEKRCLRLKKTVQNSDYPLSARHLARIRSFRT